LSLIFSGVISGKNPYYSTSNVEPLISLTDSIEIFETCRGMKFSSVFVSTLERKFSFDYLEELSNLYSVFPAKEKCM
jgi:hypothetical protein